MCSEEQICHLKKQTFLLVTAIIIAATAFAGGGGVVEAQEVDAFFFGWKPLVHAVKAIMPKWS